MKCHLLFFFLLSSRLIDFNLKSKKCTSKTDTLFILILVFNSYFSENIPSTMINMKIRDEKDVINQNSKSYILFHTDADLNIK
jgi:hypothetical protein